MPELPEVETMVRDLAPRLAGRTITGLRLPFSGSIVWPDAHEFEQRLPGQVIVGASRRGKYAIFGLFSGDALIVHRGMTGSLLHRGEADPLETHVRVIFLLDDGSELRFNDQRKFGKIYLMDREGAERPLPWAKMGPEPLDETFTSTLLERTLRGRKAPVKALLLNQEIVAGLGNIYVDEALFLARIHPRRPAGSLSTAELKRLHTAIVDVLTGAIERRGTTFSSYMDIEGRAGGFQERLQVFHRTAQGCPRCGTPIEKLVVGGRGTHICPSCQRI